VTGDVGLSALEGVGVVGSVGIVAVAVAEVAIRIRVPCAGVAWVGGPGLSITITSDKVSNKKNNNK
jgi:hypothetical protein